MLNLTCYLSDSKPCEQTRFPSHTVSMHSSINALNMQCAVMFSGVGLFGSDNLTYYTFCFPHTLYIQFMVASVYF